MFTKLVKRTFDSNKSKLKLFQLSKFNQSKVPKSQHAYIVSACRTPIGTFNGGLASLTAPQLGIIVAQAAYDRCTIPKERTDEVIFGNVCSANLGQAPARQVCLGAELPASVSCTTINKVCSSGLKSVAYAAQSIELGLKNVVLAGGMESMSNIPYYSTRTRFGARMGNTELVDGMLRDGLTNPFNFHAMGDAGEKCAKDYSISRKEQDEYAIESYKRAQKAWETNIFEQEVIPIEVPSKGSTITVERDEGCMKFNEAKLLNLKPAFDKNGSVTAGNSSQISDGAAALIVVNENILKEHNLQPLCKILSYSDAEQLPDDFTTTPSISIPLALKYAGLSLNDINSKDYFEINEAFAVVALANKKLLNINRENLNIYGGAVALGHPIGCSGARLLVTLLNALKQNRGRYGIVGICNGGGGSTAMVIENLQ